MHWLSIVPFVIILGIAIGTRQVIPALAVGLLTGCYLVHPSVLGGIEQASVYLVSDLGSPTNLYVIGFLYIFAGIVRLIQQSGGIKGFITLVSRRIRTRRQTLWMLWATVLGTFSAPDLRIVTVGPLAKALQQRIPAARERLSFIIEATGLPIIALLPVGTSFIGYMIATIALSLKAARATGNPYRLFLESIPYNLFSLVAIVLTFAYTAFGHPRLGRTDRAAQDDPQARAAHDHDVIADAHAAVGKDLPSRPWNIFIPLGAVVLLTLLVPWWVGFQKTHSVVRALVNGNVVQSMFMAILIALAITAALLLSEGFPLKTLVTEFVNGGNTLMPVIVLLALVWAIASAAERLGLAPFVTTSLRWVPGALVAPAVFALGSLLSYVLGSSFGAWGILMPIGVAMAQAAHVSLPLLIGAVFAAGTFGGLVSPFSDSTVIMAQIMDLDLMAYSRYKLKHSLIPLLLAFAGFYLVRAL